MMKVRLRARRSARRPRFHTEAGRALARFALLAALVGVGPATNVAGAQDAAVAGWTGFRGPERNGLVGGWPEPLADPANWPERLERRWQVEVGLGHASPVTVPVGGNGAILVFSRKGQEEVLRALAPADGSEIWRSAYAAPYTMNRSAIGHGPGPKATPEAGGGRVFTLGISGILSAWRIEDGSLLWRRAEDPRFSAGSSPLYGAGSSPLLLEDGPLIVHLGGPDRGLAAALDPATGMTVWEVFGDGPAYVSPVLAEIAGRPALLTMTEERILLLDPESGRILRERPFTTPYDQNIVTPVVLGGGERVIFAGLGSPTFAVRFRPGAHGLLEEPVWEAAGSPFYMSNPVLVGNRLIGFSERNSGHFTALDTETGQVLWVSPPRAGENAALLAAGRTVLALTDGGELLVLDAAANRFDPLRRYDAAPTATWAHPVPVPDGLLVKDEAHLARWRVAVGR